MRTTRRLEILLAGLAAVACLALPLQALPHQQPPHQPDHMEHRFDDPARYARSFDDPARDAWQLPDRVVAALGLQPNASVADIGAGTGYFSMHLARVVPKGTVYAVDLEPAMLSHIAKRAAAADLGNVVVVQAAASSPNLPRPVEVILIVDTYHHLPNRASYFRNLKTSLTPSGRIAIVDFRKDAPGGGPPAEFRFTPEQIIGEMKEAGYRLDAKHDFLPRQNFLIFRPL